MTFSSKKAALVAGLVLAAAAPAAFATDPVTMPTITFPITLASIGAKIAEAGGALLLVLLPISVGFAIFRKLPKRATASV